MMRRLLNRFAEHLLHGPHHEFVLGDLDEGYEQQQAARGTLVATVWFVVMTFRSAYTLRRLFHRKPDSHSFPTGNFLEGLAVDLRLGLRLVGKHPGVSITAAVVMALGTGVATFAFGAHYGLYRGLPVSDPDRMVAITSTIPEEGNTFAGVSIDDYLDFRATQTTMVDMALWDAYVQVNLSTAGAPPERVTATVASSSLHRVLEFSPLRGRLLTDEDELEHAPRVTVISETFWQRRFGGEPDVIGRSVNVGGEPVTIVGVLPAGAGFEGEDVFLPLRGASGAPDRRASRPYAVLARLRGSATLRDANEEFRLLAGRLSAAYPATNKGVSARVLSHVESRIGPAQGDRLLSLTGALILLIAIANVSNLFLVRAFARNRELQLRMAMGASRWRVVRHFLGEAIVPVTAGALAGGVLAAPALQWFSAGSPPYRFGAAHGLFVLAVASTAVVLIGVIAGIQTIRRNRNLSLTDGSRGNTARHFSRVGQGLVVAEIAAGGAALFVAGLMVKTAVKLETIDYGFAIEDVMTGTVQLDSGTYTTPEARLAFWDTFRARAKAIPGVEEATLATQLPMIRYRGWASFELDGRASASETEYLGAYANAITPEFFEAFDKSLLQGRPFTEADNAGAEPVVIVNEDLVRKFIPDGNALGRRIKLGGRGSERPWMRVVGIAPHMWMDSDVDQFPEGMYVPLPQNDVDYASIAIRVSGNPQDYREPLRETLMALDPNLPLDEPMTMERRVHERTTLYRRVGPMFVFFGAIGLILSTVGLYGVMAYMARTRTQEIGIRMALGAQNASVLRLILRQGVVQIGTGVAFGVGVALYVSTGLSRFVFQITPWDPWVLVVSFSVLALTGVVATLVPALRATKVDPLVALRAE